MQKEVSDKTTKVTIENQKTGEYIRAKAITAEEYTEKQIIQKEKVTGATITTKAGEQLKNSAAGTDNKGETIL